MGRGLSLLAVAFAAATLAACGRDEGPPPPPPANPAQTVLAPGITPTGGPTLRAVKARGRLVCGVAEMPGFATRDVFGQWRGFDVDFCKAVAAAVFGDARQVRIIPLSVKQRFTALQAQQVDLLARGGLSYTRDVGLGLDFVGTSFFDSQGFLVGKALANRTADDIGKLRVCVQAGTPLELDLSDRYRDAKTKPRKVLADSEGDAVAAYEAGRCDALTDDRSALFAVRSQLKSPKAHVVLADDIGKDPKGPVVRQGDDQWADIVRWTLNAMILAEELGVSSDDVGSTRSKPPNGEVERLLAGEGLGRMLLLRDDWVYQVIRQVGNYGEVFDRNLGGDSDVKLERGENALWNADKPGLLYAPPMR